MLPGALDFKEGKFDIGDAPDLGSAFFCSTYSDSPHRACSRCALQFCESLCEETCEGNVVECFACFMRKFFSFLGIG